jgi:hypothetical protein
MPLDGEVVRWVAAPIAYDVDPHRPSLTWLSGEVLARGGKSIFRLTG